MRPVTARPMPARALLPAVAAALLLLLWGCDDAFVEDDPGVGTAVQTEDLPTPGLSVPTDAPVDLEAPVNLSGEAVVEGGTIEIETTETFAFEPTFVATAPGEDVAIELSNPDNQPHTFTIDELDIDVLVDEQGTESAGVEMPESGHLRYYCRFHEFEGMVGAFYVAEGEAAE